MSNTKKSIFTGVNDFFSADSHYGHRNILDYANRPFSSIQEHDETLIQNWNSVVKKGDRVFHLGDIFLCTVPHAAKIMNRLNGQKYLILGNHDKIAINGEVRRYFQWQKEAFYYKAGETRIYLLHYGCRTWRNAYRGTWHLYGHSHANLPPQGKSFDCGVDTTYGGHPRFFPYHFEEVRKVMDTLEWVPPEDYVEH